MAKLKSSNFKKGVPQDNLGEGKSKGQIARSAGYNLLLHLRACIGEKNLVGKTVTGVCDEVDRGEFKNALELLKMAKETEKQDLNLSGLLGVQKVFVSEKTENDVNAHIDGIIDGGGTST